VAQRPVSASARPRRGVSDLARAEERTAWLLLLPSIFVLLVVAIYPLGSVFVSSFTNARFASATPTQFVGFTNYQNLLSFTLRQVPYELGDAGERVYPNSRIFLRRLETARPYDEVRTFNLFGNRYVLGATNAPFIRSIIDTVTFTVVTVGLETLLGMIIALALAAKFFGRNVMRTAMLVPWAIITVVSALIWEWMYQSNRAGFFNALFNALGWSDGNIGFLTNPAYQMPSIIAIDVWKTTPFMALLLLAGLATIPSELYEAAAIDGASKVRQFFSVTLPLLMPTLAVALIFRTLDALRVFDLFQVVFGERRYSMASFAQDTLISNRNVGLSSAASVVIFFIIFAFAIFYIRTLGVRDSE
jgi:trehalose/maltose transport system permease protein